MKKVFKGLLVVFIMLTAIGFSTSLLLPSEFVIKVTGTKGTKFQGAYIVTNLGQAESKSVDGTLPAEFKAKGNMVSVSFQKSQRDGALQVEIFKDGNQVGKSDTSAEFGLVGLASQ